MPSEKEIKAASAELRVWMPKALVTTQAVTAILSAAEKEREGHRADCYWLRSTPAVDGDEAACCSCGAVERAEREGETHNGVCLRCGSGVLASGEHIRTDLPPCGREGDIIEKLREWAKEGGNAPEISNHVADYTAGWGDGYALALADLGDFLDDPQGQGDDLFWRSYRNGRYVALEELREWERRQREAWEASHSSGADGVRTGTALGVLDRLSCFLNDLQKQSTGAVGEGDGTSPGEEQ